MTQPPPTDASRPFARYLLDTRLEDVPPVVIAATKRSLFDTVGVMLAGSGPHGGAHRVVRMLSMWGGLPSSTVIGHELRLPAPHAAFANGAMAHQFDFDDTHDQAVAHPTANTLAAGLAVAEALDGASGGDLLRAVVLGNDLTCRLGLAIEGSLYEYPWTRPPIIGIWGATAAASVLLGLDEDRIRSAFGLTLHQTANTLECLYSPNSEVRGLRDGFSARNGVTAACMAQAGIQADHTAFEGRFGLFHAYFRGEYRRAALLDELGSRFEGEHVSIKPWPSARETHATIQAVLELRDRHELDPASIRSVMLRVGKTNLEFCEPGDVRRAPPSRMDALSGTLPCRRATAMCRSAPMSAKDWAIPPCWISRARCTGPKTTSARWTARSRGGGSASHSTMAACSRTAYAMPSAIPIIPWTAPICSTSSQAAGRWQPPRLRSRQYKSCGTSSIRWRHARWPI